MTARDLLDLCLQWPGGYEDYPFDEAPGPDSWAVVRHRGNKKIFAAVYRRHGRVWLNLKCDPLEAEFLRGQFAAVTPGWHMNKLHWNTVDPDGVPRAVLEAMIEGSYRLTMPKKAVRERT